MISISLGFISRRTGGPMKNTMEKSEYKAILHSKRANIYYLSKCRVMQKDGRVLYLTETEKGNAYWNIPIANTTVILLGNGTSITQAAMRLLSGAGWWCDAALGRDRDRVAESTK